jgi:hypothetical protein
MKKNRLHCGVIDIDAGIIDVKIGGINEMNGPVCKYWYPAMGVVETP